MINFLTVLGLFVIVSVTKYLAGIIIEDLIPFEQYSFVVNEIYTDIIITILICYCSNIL